MEAINDGRLIYLRTNRPTTFHHAHAKNLVHKAAADGVLCAVDADATINTNLIATVYRTFALNINSMMIIDKEDWQAVGFIAISKENFCRLGGYNEKMYGWGYEDLDLRIRAGRMRLAVHEHQPGDDYQNITHKNRMRVRNVEIKQIKVSHGLNRDISKSTTGFVVNGEHWGGAELVRNFRTRLAF